MMIDGLLRSVSSWHTNMDQEALAGVMKDMALGGLLALGGSRPIAVESA
jgi:hypothetical protein